MDYDDFSRVLAAERLPAVLVDLDAFDRNVSKLAAMARAGGRLTVRTATKSLRVPALIQRVLDHRQPYRGLMCYAAEEAQFLAERGFDDLLVAYPTVQPSDLAAVRAVHESGKLIRLVVDSIETLASVNRAMAGCSRPLPLVLEVDMSLRPLAGRVHLGVRRSPVRSADEVLACFRQAASYGQVRLVGLMGYEAQVAGLGDRSPFKPWLNPAKRAIRKWSVKWDRRLRQETAERLQREGFAIEIFNGGGTGSVSLAADESWLTELAAGSGFLCSHLFDYYSNLDLEPACFFALQTVRSSDAGYVTCLGGGYVASGEPGWDKVPRPHLPAGLQLVSTEACGEVQTPLRLKGATPLAIGAPVLFRHAKAGELAEHFREYLLVSQGKIVERAPTYRGMGQCFF